MATFLCVLGSPVRAPEDISHGFRGGGSAGSFMLQCVLPGRDTELGAEPEFDVQKLVSSLCLCMCVKYNWIINQGCESLVPSCCLSTFIIFFFFLSLVRLLLRCRKQDAHV